MTPAPSPAVPSLRALRDDEIERAYGIYLAACAWLKGKGVRQWMTPKPSPAFDERQIRGENYGLFLGNDLVAIATLSLEVHVYWTEELGSERRWWLHTLAVAPGFHGRSLGEEAVAAAATLLHSRGAGELWLDCGADGVLPGYYGELGFAVLGKKDIAYPSGNTYPIMLMRKVIEA